MSSRLQEVLNRLRKIALPPRSEQAIDRLTAHYAEEHPPRSYPEFVDRVGDFARASAAVLPAGERLNRGDGFALARMALEQAYGSDRGRGLSHAALDWLEDYPGAAAAIFEAIGGSLKERYLRQRRIALLHELGISGDWSIRMRIIDEILSSGDLSPSRCSLASGLDSWLLELAALPEI